MQYTRPAPPLTPVVNLDGGGTARPGQAEAGPEVAVGGGARRLAREDAAQRGEAGGSTACRGSRQRRSTQARRLLAAVVSSTAAIRYAALKVSRSAEGCHAIVSRHRPLSRNAGVLTPPAQVGQGRRKKARLPTMVPGAVGLYAQATHPPVLALRGAAAQQRGMLPFTQQAPPLAAGL